MGDPTQDTSTVVSQPATPAPPVAPEVATPQAAPVDVSGGTPPPNAQDAAIGSANASFAQANKGYADAAAEMKKPVVDPTVPHAKLLSIINAIGIGLSSFGAAASTGGREGGAPMVQKYYAGQQEQKLEAHKSLVADKNQQIQQQMMVADTNMRMGQNFMLMAKLPNEITKDNLEVKGMAQGQAITGADFQAQHGGMKPEEFSAALSGTAPASGQTGTASFFTTNAKQQLDAATKILGADDPYVQKLQTALGDAKATPKDLWTATNQLQSQVALQEKATTAAGQKADLQSKQQSADPLFKYQSDPKALADPGAQQTLKAYIDDPKNADNLNGIAQAKSLIAKAGIAQQHAIALDAQKAQANKNAEQAAAAGDPTVTGQMLYDGTLTLTDLKSRGSTPKQITDAVSAAENIAKKAGGKYNATDEIVGEHTLSTPSNQVFFGSARSLVQRGGMLDQLKAAHDTLGNTKLPSLNTIKNVTEYQAGSPELATYRAALLNAADDAAKVMGGGTPTDQLRDMFLQTYAANINNLGFDGAIKQAKDGVRSQVTGRIGSNRYVGQREGDILHDHQIGDTVTLKSGQKVVIKSLDADGNATY